MFYKCIVAGFDGSDASRKAVERAVEIAKLTGAKLYIVTVIPPPTVFLGELLVPEITDVSRLEKASRNNLDSIVKEIREVTGLTNIEPIVLMGDPAEELVGFAEEKECNLIVLGRRGRGGLERFILGSVSNKVISISHKADVLVVTPETGAK